MRAGRESGPYMTYLDRSCNEYCKHYCGRKGIWFKYDIAMNYCGRKGIWFKYDIAMNTVSTSYCGKGNLVT